MLVPNLTLSLGPNRATGEVFGWEQKRAVKRYLGFWEQSKNIDMIVIKSPKVGQSSNQARAIHSCCRNNPIRSGYKC